MKTKLTCLSIFFIFFFSCSDDHSKLKKPIDYVNPMIGTSNKGNTFPGASVPFGMTYAAPNNSREAKWSGSRYFFGEAYFYGFSQNNLSGVGCADFANINIMASSGKVFPGYFKNRSRYKNEKSRPGHYSVYLTEHDIKAEVTATDRTTLTKFVFPESQGKSNILIDITEGLSESRGGYARITGKNEIVGWNRAGGFCDEGNEYTIYFVSQFSKEADIFGTWNKRNFNSGKNEESGKDIGVYMSFSTRANEPVYVKTGISYVSIENARENLAFEQPGFNFPRVKNQAMQRWNTELSKIKVYGGSEEDKVKFYSALYHTLIHPNIINDVNGEYPAMITHETKRVENRNQYTVYSLWDTYRTLHPLFTLVYPERQTEMLQTMADMAETTGWLPFWELGADETYVMNGDPAPIVITDSYLKGLKDFDLDIVYEAMRRSAMDTIFNPIRPMQKYFSRHGYIPWDDCGPDDRWGKPRMVSECLEYAYADWATAKMAKETGETDLANYLFDRSKAYKHYFDADTGFLRPRYVDGSWFSPFYPSSYEGSWHNPGFVEGNSWQYTFFVPHDIKGLVKTMGGKKAFISKLQRCFDEKNFTIDNEPDITYPFLFSYFNGEEWRTQEIVRELMEHEFGTNYNGLPGNDDAGTISGWYLFSAMGIYPALVGSPEYVISSPVFSRIEIQLNQDYYPAEQFVITADGNSKENIFIQDIHIGGKHSDHYVIKHDQIINGEHLNLKMSANRKDK